VGVQFTRAGHIAITPHSPCTTDMLLQHSDIFGPCVTHKKLFDDLAFEHDRSWYSLVISPTKITSIFPPSCHRAQKELRKASSHHHLSPCPFSSLSYHPSSSSSLLCLTYLHHLSSNYWHITWLSVWPCAKKFLLTNQNLFPSTTHPGHQQIMIRCLYIVVLVLPSLLSSSNLIFSLCKASLFSQRS
jgi:hypothetical protein